MTWWEITIRSLNRIQAWLFALTLLQGVALLALIRLGQVPMRWSYPSPHPKVAISRQPRPPVQRST